MAETERGGPESLEDLRARVIELEREAAAAREMQAALAKSEERFTLAVQGTTDGLWDWEVGTEYVYYADRFKALLGYGPEEFENRFEEFESRLHPEDLGPTLEAVRRHLEANVPYDVEYRLRCKGGEYRWFRARGAAIRDADGKATRMAGSISDITERRDADRKLDEAREDIVAARNRLGAFFDLSLEMLCIAGIDGYFKQVNPAFSETLGYSSAEAPLAEPFLSLVHPDDQASTLAEVEKLAGGERTIRFLNRYRHREGHYRWFDWNAAVDPQLGLLYSVARDVTDRRREEEELLEAKLAAESANRAKSEFLANMSHEIRTPMNGIIGMTELLLNTELSPRQREYQKLVLESAESLLTVLNDVLDFSKIEAGRLELDPQEFDLRNAIGDILQALGVRSTQSGLELAYHVAPDVPHFVIADLGRLRQVLVNLVGNALKFTERGEVVVDVGVASRRAGRVSLDVAVRDTGIGIPREKVALIFDPFTQAEGSTTRRFGGTGLGLAICRQIVELMGGSISVESDESIGSVFRFTAWCDMGKEPRAEEVSLASAVLPGADVLVVDDNGTHRMILAEMLRSWGLRPRLASSAAEALGLIGDNCSPEGPRFALVLSDVMMPEMDGVTLAGELRRCCKECPKLILLSSAGGTEELVSARAGNRASLGIEKILSKPVKQSDLLDAVTSSLGGGRARLAAPVRQEAEAVERGRPEGMPALEILLAEDGRVNRIVARKLLERRGHRVTVAANGRQALEAYEQGRFDAILMDVQMPEMDGCEATRAIRDREEVSGQRVPIIAMTANAMTGDREACLDAGMDDYLAKPVRAQELYEVLERRARPAR